MVATIAAQYGPANTYVSLGICVDVNLCTFELLYCLLAICCFTLPVDQKMFYDWMPFTPTFDAYLNTIIQL